MRSTEFCLCDAATRIWKKNAGPPTVSERERHSADSRAIGLRLTVEAAQ